MMSITGLHQQWGRLFFIRLKVFMFTVGLHVVTRSFTPPSIVVYGVNNRAATATGSFVPLRCVQDDRRRLPTRIGHVLLSVAKELVALLLK